MRKWLTTLAILLPACCWAAAQDSPPGQDTGQDQQVPTIFPSVSQTRLAVADFVARTRANRETETALDVFNRVLWDDLEFSAFFEMPSKDFYPLRPLRAPQDVNFEDWKVPTLEVDFLAFGNIQSEAAGATVVEAFLFDVKTRQQVLGKRYRLPRPDQVRRTAHAFGDEVVFQLSAGASRGVAQTQIAYTSKQGGSKEIFIADYDGFNRRTITANGGINKFPDWSSESSTLAFVTNLPGSARWELWLQDLAGTAGRQVLQVPTSYVSSPAFSPDGARIAFSARAADRSDSDIYVSPPDGSRLLNLTRNPAIDTAPTWSPTGRQIVFVSNRSGTPQLWLMDSDGTNLSRLSEEGGHCDSPDWSPDGKFVAYSWQAPKQWKHDIFIIEVATGRTWQVTSGRGSHENPHWSPDGRHLAFQSTRTGSKQIFIINADGSNLKQITAYGINENPAWSGYRKLEEE